MHSACLYKSAIHAEDSVASNAGGAICACPITVTIYPISPNSVLAAITPAELNHLIGHRAINRA